MNPSTRRALSASAWLHCAYFACVGLFATYSPLWYKDLGVPLIEIGWLLSLPSLTRLFAPFAWGAMADHGGHRVGIIRFAALGSLVAALAFLAAPSIGWIALGAFGMYCFNAAITPLNEVVVASHMTTADGGVDARRYGLVRLWGSVGFLVTVLLGGLGLEQVGMRAFVPALLVLLLGIVLASWRLDGGPEVELAHAPTPPLMEVMRQPRVMWFFAGVFLTVLAHTALYSFFSLYLDELGYGKSEVGLLWGVSVVAEVGWFAFQGRMLERGTLHLWLVGAALLAALRFALTAAFGASFWALVLFQCGHAVTFAAQHTACIGLVNRYFPGRLRGRGQALYTVLGYGVSGVLGAIGGGWMVAQWGLASVFWAASIAALLGAACCWQGQHADRLADKVLHT